MAASAARSATTTRSTSMAKLNVTAFVEDVRNLSKDGRCQLSWPVGGGELIRVG